MKNINMAACTFSYGGENLHLAPESSLCVRMRMMHDHDRDQSQHNYTLDRSNNNNSIIDPINVILRYY